MPFLNTTFKIQAYSDRQVNSNPRLKNVDWLRDASGLPIQNARSDSYELLPGATLNVFNGARTTTIDGTTVLTVSLSPLDPSRYRFTWSGGTAPGLRTDRALQLSGITVTLTVNTNQTVDVVLGSGAHDFTGVLAGDSVWIPGVTTGDVAGPFSPLNEGAWQVLAVVSSTHIVLARLPGVTFNGASETQTPSANSQFQAFSAAGVQVGDVVDITAGFPLPLTSAFQVVQVTSTWFEIISTLALPLIASSGALGITFYSSGKSFLYVEGDQEFAVQVNGDTGQSNRCSPGEPGNQDQPGLYLKRGVTWSLNIVNRSQVSLNIVVITAE